MKKYSLIMIIAAAILLEVMGAAQYVMATYGTESELMSKANRDMEKSQSVAAVKSEVESALRNIHKAAEMSLDNPKGYYTIATGVVKYNPHIVGAGVAFRPDYYKARGMGRLYAPYVYDRQPDVRLKKMKTAEPMLTSTLLPFDYTNREWFKRPLANSGSLWTEPYVDQGGTHIILCTFVMPLADRSGKVVGVFFADVPMEDVSLLSMEFHRGIKNGRIILLIIQVISLIVIAFVVWLSIRAFRRYKGQYVDPEKTHLVDQIAKLREVNTRLTKRNQELASTVAELRKQVNAMSQTTVSQTTDSTWYR